MIKILNFRHSSGVLILVILLTIFKSGQMFQYEFQSSISSLKARCPNPASIGITFQRIENTRFYIYLVPSTFEEGKTYCDKFGKAGVGKTLRLAKIANIEEDVMVGRNLEKYARKNAASSYKWWVSAKYDAKDKVYRWIYKNEAVKYHNLNEKYAHVIGRTPGCMTVGLPFPMNNIYGWGYSWDPVPCDSKQYTLCESVDDDCDILPIYTIEQKRYHGFFPLSQRRFSISWKLATYEEAEILCKDKKMVLYTPGNADTCLFTNIKEHRPYVTKFHFWAAPPPLPDPDHKPQFCPAAVYTYETHNACNCKWRYVVTAPADCKLHNSVICEVPDSKEDLVDLQRCKWPESFLIEIDRKKDVHRSSDKETYMNAEIQCRKHAFQIVTFADLMSRVKFTINYDKEETYWIHTSSIDNPNKCLVGFYDKKQSVRWQQREAKCHEPHFYLCGTDQSPNNKDKRKKRSADQLYSNWLNTSSEESYFRPQHLVEEVKVSYNSAVHECKARRMNLIDTSFKKNREFVEMLASTNLQRPVWILNQNSDFKYTVKSSTRRFKECLAVNEYGNNEWFYCHAQLSFVCE